METCYYIRQQYSFNHLHFIIWENFIGNYVILTSLLGNMHNTVSQNIFT